MGRNQWMMNIRLPAALMFTKAPDVWSRNAVRTHRRRQSCACRIRSLPPLRTCGRHGARERHPELQTSRSNIPRPRDMPSKGYLGTRAASKFWCWSSETLLHLIAAEISGMRCSFGNKYGFRFWCWNALFWPMIAPFLPVIAQSLPVQNFHCAVFVELRAVFYIAPFLRTCA